LINSTGVFLPPKLATRNRTLLEKLTVAQLVKNLSAFYGTRRFITVFTGPF